MKKFIIVDGQGLLYRAFYALPQLTTSYGQIINAAYGFTLILIKLLEEEKPDYMVIAFDTPQPTFRHKEFEDYKIHRPKMPDELVSQIPLVKEIIRGYNIFSCSKEGYEADDIIGTLAKEAEKRNNNTLIVSGDKDAFQLISPLTKVVTPVKGVTEVKIYDQESIKNKYGLEPQKIVDLIALKGDPSDNLPGVPGIGEKTALDLINKFGSLDNLFREIDKVPRKSLREQLIKYKEQVLMSKKLATIVTEVPLDYDFEDFKIKPPCHEELEKIFRKLEFKNLLKKISPKIGEESNHRNNKIKYNLVENEEKLGELTRLMEKNEYFSFCLVTIPNPNGVSPQISGIALSFRPEGTFYLPTFPLNLIEKLNYLPLEVVLKELGPFFKEEKVEKIGHNLKSDFIILNKYGIELSENNFDTMIAAYLLNPSLEKYDLPDLFWEYLGYLKNEEAPKRGGNFYAQIEDICDSTYEMLQLKEVLEEKLKEKDLIPLFKEIEMPLLRILGEMEINGVKVDIDFLKKMSKQVDWRLKELEEEIYNLAGGRFNIDSPKQLGKILFERLKLPVIKKTKTGYSTDSSVLNILAPQHKVVSSILEYRELGKLKNTYIDKLILLADAHTFRIHTSFHQTVTSTGRLSSSEPNLQNIPIRTEIGRKIRKAFIAEKDFILLSADYSQVELRILAHLSQDEGLLEAFRNNEDIHTHTAADIFDLDQDLITEPMRRMAKTINFGIIYGMSSYGLARHLGVGREEAEKYIYHYFQKFPGVKSYIEEEKEEARKKGYVVTLLNRRRYVEGINSSDRNIREFNERIAINTPIQGSAADLIKLAMIKIDRLLKSKKFKTKLLLQIHDELLFEVYQPELEEVKSFVKDIMEHALELSVPLEVNLKTGHNWAELT